MFQGVGIAMIGGMYWKRGTVPAAYSAISMMCIIPLLDLIFRRVFEGTYDINVGYVMFGTICASSIAYIIISLLTYKGRIENV
jgi:SSS family solute:Na+ symporter